MIAHSRVNQVLLQYIMVTLSYIYYVNYIAIYMSCNQLNCNRVNTKITVKSKKYHFKLIAMINYKSKQYFYKMH